jgi:hypothetical protein
VSVGAIEGNVPTRSGFSAFGFAHRSSANPGATNGVTTDHSCLLLSTLKIPIGLPSCVTDGRTALNG